MPNFKFVNVSPDGLSPLDAIVPTGIVLIQLEYCIYPE